MRIFVTGGTGFIGRHVVKELATPENKLLLLSRRSASPFSPPDAADVKVLKGDLAGIKNLEKEIKGFAPEAAIHLAWEGLPDYSAETSTRNLNYGLDLIHLLAGAGCKAFIGAGSCWEYGQQSGKVSEDADLKPYNDFTAAKNALRERGEKIAKEHGMHFIWLRLFYVYGPGQRNYSLMPYLINCLRKGEKPDIKTPQNKNDFLYVEDAARAIAAVVQKPEKSGVYNVGSGASTSVRQIVEIIGRRFNFEGKYDTLSVTGDSPATDFWADISRIRQDYGWEPRTGISEGIQKTIESL